MYKRQGPTGSTGSTGSTGGSTGSTALYTALTLSLIHISRVVFMLKILFFLRTFCPKACIPQPNRVLYYYKKSGNPKEVYFMEWTDIRLTVAKADADNAEARCA